MCKARVQQVVLCLSMLVLALACTPTVWAQSSFKRATTPWPWQFPRDHGSHPEFQTEWWYFTGALQTVQGATFGYELTFFRFALRAESVRTSSSWRTRDLILAHFAITDVEGQKFHLEENLQRAAAGLAGADETSLHVWMNDWRAKSSGKDIDLVAGTQNRVQLQLRQKQDPILHGDQGLSWKSDDRQHASHYYSMPRLDTRGTLWWEGQQLEVTGTTWMDHEFFSDEILAQGAGWDWFSCRLEDGRDLMLYLLRYPDGSTYRSGTLVESSGAYRALDVTDMTLQPLRSWVSPVTDTEYPVAWSLTLPNESITLQVEARVDQQEVLATETVGFAYWEGLSRFTGSIHDVPVQGQGYVELTGYAKAEEARQ